jgi:hypothetical protein
MNKCKYASFFKNSVTIYMFVPYNIYGNAMSNCCIFDTQRLFPVLAHMWLVTLIRTPRRRSIVFYKLNARPSFI